VWNKFVKREGGEAKGRGRWIEEGIANPDVAFIPTTTITVFICQKSDTRKGKCPSKLPSLQKTRTFKRKYRCVF